MKIFTAEEKKLETLVFCSGDVYDGNSVVSDILARLDSMLAKAHCEIIVQKTEGINPSYEVSILRKPMKRTRRTRKVSLLD